MSSKNANRIPSPTTIVMTFRYSSLIHAPARGAEKIVIARATMMMLNIEKWSIPSPYGGAGPWLIEVRSSQATSHAMIATSAIEAIISILIKSATLKVKKKITFSLELALINKFEVILATINVLSISIGVYIVSMASMNFDPFIPANLSGYGVAPYAQLFAIIVGMILVLAPPIASIAALSID